VAGVLHFPLACSWAVSPATAFKPLGFRAQLPVSQQYPDEEAADEDQADRVGCDDEADVVCGEVHQRSPISAMWIWRILRAAISVRIDTR
jgi:hypothetical protein